MDHALDPGVPAGKRLPSRPGITPVGAGAGVEVVEVLGGTYEDEDAADELGSMVGMADGEDDATGDGDGVELADGVADGGTPTRGGGIDVAGRGRTVVEEGLEQYAFRTRVYWTGRAPTRAIKREIAKIRTRLANISRGVQG